MAGMKAYSKAYYIQNNKRIKSLARIAYKIGKINLLQLVHCPNWCIH